jgi:hypothetical protein
VSDVVEKKRGAHETPLVRDISSVGEERRAGLSELIEGARSDGERAERVRKARVFGGWKGEIREAELAQPPQPLQLRKVEQPRLALIELDETVDRVEYPLHG